MTLNFPKIHYVVFFFYIHVTVPNCTFVYFPPDLSQNLQELKEIGRSGRKGRTIFLGWVRLFCRFFGGWGGSICRGKEQVHDGAVGRTRLKNDVTRALSQLKIKPIRPVLLPCYCKKQTDGSFLWSVLLYTIK